MTTPLTAMPVLTLVKHVRRPRRLEDNPLSVRTFRSAEDIEVWLRIQNAALAGVRRGRPWDQGDFFRQLAGRSWWTPDSLLFAEPRCPGVPPVATLAIHLTADQEGPLATVHWLAVLPEWQRQGAGRRLIETVERRCVAGGIERIQCETLGAWRESLAFYRALGFVDRRLGCER